jgi:plastocyanin
MLASSFTPIPVTVNRGATVTFQNTSGIGHTVLFDAPRSPGVDDIGLHSAGTNTRDFTQAGRFPFHCDRHAGMTGEIVVN